MEEVEQNSVRRRLEEVGAVSNSDFATTRRGLAEQGCGRGCQRCETPLFVSREHNGTSFGVTSGEEKPLSSDANRVHQAVDPARLISDLCGAWSGDRMRCEGCCHR